MGNSRRDVTLLSWQKERIHNETVQKNITIALYDSAFVYHKAYCILWVN